MKTPRGSVTVGSALVAAVALAAVVLVTAACGRSPGTGSSNNNNQNNVSDLCPAGYLLVPRGTYIMGVDAEDVAGLDGAEWSPDMGPAHKVTLSSDFCMSKTEVTVAEYRTCRDTGGCTGEGPWPMAGNLGCNYHDTDQSRDNHPVNCLTYEQAQEYCQAQGGNLPTEAQWIRAAQGDDRRPFAWGSSGPDCSHANYDVNGIGGLEENGEGCAETLSPPYTWAVGNALAGASPYGLLDMTGNVSEYLLGCRSVFKVCDGELGCVDPQPPGCDGVVFKRVAGGSALAIYWSLYSFERIESSVDQMPSIGMRCVVAPKTR